MVRISVVQTSPAYLKLSINLKKMESLVASVGSDLFIFPELCTSGYNFQKKHHLKKVGESGSASLSRSFFEKLAKRKNGAVVAGFVEKDRNHYFNSAYVITPQKTQIYRKIHLFNTEKRFFTPGKKPAFITRWKGLRFGTMICFDWLFPEMSRSLSLQGADLIAHPSNLVMPYAPDGMKIRSLENHVYTATANRVGSEFGIRFIGQSQITNPKGRLLGRLKRKTGVLTVLLDPQKARNKFLTKRNHVLRDRQPRCYAIS